MLAEGLREIPWKPMLHLWKAPKQCPIPPSPDFSVSTDHCVQLRRPSREMPVHWGYDSVVYRYFTILPAASIPLEDGNSEEEVPLVTGPGS